MLDALHFIVCGTVDSGRSTLISWLLEGRSQAAKCHFGEEAYSHFSTAGRKFSVVNDAAHEQYKQNAVISAPSADFAVILVDASKGGVTETKRQSRILSMFEVPRVVLAVNKMDRIGWDEAASTSSCQISKVSLRALNSNQCKLF